MLRKALFPVLAFALLWGLVRPASSQPNNDECDNDKLHAITCNTVDTDDMTGATSDEDETDRVASCAEYNSGGNPTVWWKLTIPSGHWKVTIEISALAGANIQLIGAGLGLTNSTDPCQGPFESKGGEWQTQPWGQEYKCLDGGTYLLPISFWKLAEIPTGGYKVDVDCEECEPQPKGSGNTSDEQGEAQTSFNFPESVYFDGIGFPSDAFFACFIVRDTSWVESMEIPPRMPGTPTWVGADSNGTIVNSSVLLPGVGDTLTAPALFWSQPVDGCYDIVFDMNGDGFYQEAYDALIEGGPGGGSAFCTTGYPGDIPTLTERGLIILGVVLLGFITWVFLRRRKAVVSLR